MIEVSDAWKDVQQRFLLPETFIEIDCALISDHEALENATVTGTDEQPALSGAWYVTKHYNNLSKGVKYATNELNLWALDGTTKIIPSSGADRNAGYISDTASTGSVLIEWTEPRTVASAGVTITWSSIYGEYPSVFTVTAKNGENIVAEETVTDNTEQVSIVPIDLQNYDSITVTVHNWGLPNRRVRMEKIVIGSVMTLTKDDIISFKHEQTGDILSGEVPKYSIEFSLDNSDGRWDPNNPSGMERYLLERQKLDVRYGLDLGDTVEWIKAGTFYLSEWYTPSNGLETHFVARDVFEFLLGAGVEKRPNMSTTIYGDWAFVARWATATTLPAGVSLVIDSSLNSADGAFEPSLVGNFAEILQKCANAARCILRYDRDGTLYIEPLNKTLSDYRITAALSYSHPEIKLSKPLKEVVVDYGGEQPRSFPVADTGETQTLANDFINVGSYGGLFAGRVADWVAGVLKNRTTISGEFRADPRLDLYDIVTVESKYGALTPVVITSITYTFNGSFRGSYTGRVLEV